MDKIVGRLEAVVSKIAGGSAGGDEGSPVAVTEYDNFYKSAVQPFVDSCNKLEETKVLGTWTEAGFKHARNVIEASTQCKKPDNAEFLSFCAPITKVLSDCKPDNRSPVFNQYKGFLALVGCLDPKNPMGGGVLMAPGPKTVCDMALEECDFFLNKVLTGCKDKPDPEKTDTRGWVANLKKCINGLGDYFNDFHKTGLAWKFSGGALSAFKPGQKAAGGGAEQKSAGVESRLEALCAQLEAFAAKQGGGSSGGEPACVAAYKEYYDASVVPFVAVCKKLKMDNVAGWAEKAFTQVGRVIKATTECKKPAPEAYMAFLGPLSEQIGAAGNPNNRAPTFNQEKAFAEGIQALQFVCMDGGPKDYINSMAEAAQMFGNKVLMVAKDKEDPEKTDLRDYVKLLKAMLTNLADYGHEHFKMGLTWKVKDGKDIKDFK